MLRATFMTSRNAFRPVFARGFTAGQTNKELASALKTELDEERSEERDASFLTQFKSEGVWTLQDTLGKKEFKLQRTFGDEKISVFVSTDAMQFDEHGAPEEEADEEEPVGLTILIEREGHGTLEIAASAEEEVFYIDNVAHFDSAVAKDETSEGDWNRRGIYGGPQFPSLNPAVVETFHKYLEERGFDSSLAKFIPQYVEHKEQREYENWLERVVKFVSK